MKKIKIKSILNYKTFFVSVVAMVAISAFSLVHSCSNSEVDEHPNAKGTFDNPDVATAQKNNPDMDYFTTHVVSSMQDDYYSLIDPDHNVFEWRTFEDGTFVFDKEIEWDFGRNLIGLDNVTPTSFTAYFDDGDSLNVFNVSTAGLVTTCNIYSVEGDLVYLTTTHSIPVDLMKMINELYTSSNTNSKYVSISPIGVMKAIYKVASLTVNVYFGVKDARCEKGMRQAAKECNKYDNCKALKHQCSLECACKVANADCTCALHSWFGD
ncbi:MAG: hypothetical protein IJ789_03465 [Bacteroidales bacterium]|nr:hypothetical protein [Bacteroidales bacterium]